MVIIHQSMSVLFSLDLLTHQAEMAVEALALLKLTLQLAQDGVQMTDVFINLAI